MKKVFAALLALLSAVVLAGCSGGSSALNKNDPVTLTMWHVYGEQADSPMNRLVAEFNETAGREKGIIINVTLMTNTSEMGGKLLDAMNGVPGASEMPDLFFCHVNNAAALGAENVLDWNDHFTEDELNAFVDDFIKDGMTGSRLSVLPVSKSTHMLFINGTQFDSFSADTGVTYDSLATWDGFFEAAAKYYEWSGGKTFCAFDYLLRCVELNSLATGGVFYDAEGWYDFSSESLKASWMQFARALVQGHIAVSDLYSNTQVMTGETIAGMGSSAAILYYNDVVTYPDNTMEPMQLRVLPMPTAENGRALMTQAGVGLCAYKTTDKKAEAASVFAHWLTESRRNLEFVVDTGYMPVNEAAFDAIDDYEFADESRRELYGALESMLDTRTAVREPNHVGYYDSVYVLYDRLRAIQPELKRRADAGESVEALAAETWQLFTAARQNG